MRSHLTELIHELLLSKNPKVLEDLESLSLEVKKAHFDANQPGSKVSRRNKMRKATTALVVPPQLLLLSGLLACATGRAGSGPGGRAILRTPCPFISECRARATPCISLFQVCSVGPVVAAGPFDPSGDD